MCARPAADRHNQAVHTRSQVKTDREKQNSLVCEACIVLLVHRLTTLVSPRCHIGAAAVDSSSCEKHIKSNSQPEIDGGASVGCRPLSHGEFLSVLVILSGLRGSEAAGEKGTHHDTKRMLRSTLADLIQGEARKSELREAQSGQMKLMRMIRGRPSR